jgi:hypothetical protein
MLREVRLVDARAPLRAQPDSSKRGNAKYPAGINWEMDVVLAGPA